MDLWVFNKLKLQYAKDIESNGVYLKVDPQLDPSTLGNPTPSSIRFGPDEYEHTAKTHPIFTYEGNSALKMSDHGYRQGEDSGIFHVRHMILMSDATDHVEILSFFQKFWLSHRLVASPSLF